MSTGNGDALIHVHQGEFRVSAAPNLIMTTVLGSCVAACMHDPVARVGGMNHFLLPEGVGATNSAANRYGVHLMELLLNQLLQAGARRDRIEAKLFGGARLVDGLSDIGARNAEFAQRFLSDESIPVVATSLKGACARRIQYWPASGRSRQRQLPAESGPSSAERVVHPVAVGDVELFV